MIHYSLVCDDGHEFDGWFRDSDAFDAQVAQGLIGCPFCQSTKVSRAVMAPSVARGAAFLDKRHADLRQMIRDLRETILSATEDVGEKFPQEARKLHDGDGEPRAIRGQASLEEAKALIEDGIEILPLPAPPGEGN